MEEIQAGLRGVYRFLIFLVLVLFYLVRGFLIHFTTRDPLVRRKKFSENTTFCCHLMISSMGVRLKVVNKPVDDSACLVVSNHMGFIDILCLASIRPNLFVTSNEMRETPFLGLLTEMAGCLYVERRNRSKILGELQNLVDALKAGFRVGLYPEATSTNGEQVLPFKRTLLMAAAKAGVPIQPAVFNFRSINGEEFSLKWRDHVCWYGDIPFVTSMWKSMTLKYVDVEIEFLAPQLVSPDEDRGVVADRIHSMIASKFTPVKLVGSPAIVPMELET